MLDTTMLESKRRGEIRDAWVEVRRARPKIRQRDAAALLGVSEGELLASRVGRDVVPLRSDWPAMLREFAAIGPVKTITRNAQAVHETVGVYDHLSFVATFGLVQSRGLDLRLLLERWAAGFLVRERSEDAVRCSLEFYDRHGEAVHKIFPEKGSDPAAIAAIEQRYAAADAHPFAFVAAPPRPPTVRGHCDAVASGLLGDWARLQDTHDFGSMLERHGVSRLPALELAQGRFTSSQPVAALAPFLQRVASAKVPLMVFVESPGSVQIHTGAITRVKRIGPWLNILEDDFNLHLLEEELSSMWIVEKPTSDGIVTSLEAYAADDSQVVVFYGARKPGKPELPSWRALIDGLRSAGGAS